MSKQTEEANKWLDNHFKIPGNTHKAWKFLKKLQDNAQQSPVTDEQIESYARVICTVTFKNGSKVSPPQEIARCIKMGKLIRDLQPKTDDWVSVSERLPKKSGRYNVFDGDNVIIWRFKYGRFRNKFITHWQDLPQPPNNKNR